MTRITTHTVRHTVTTTTDDVSLAKLIPSPANVRRTGAGTGIEALAASIQAHGLLQSLVVRPALDANGQEPDRFEVVAGGRRLAGSKPYPSPAVESSFGRRLVKIASRSGRPIQRLPRQW